MDAPSDLIVDVARAADPVRAATVTRRLEALSSSGGVGTPDFANALSTAGASAQPATFAGGAAANLTGARLAPPGSLPAAPSRVDKARERFEATLLNAFISEMMPKEASSVYGEGYAGEMWKSLLAEKVSDEIAKTDALGLGRTLFSGGQASALENLGTTSRANSARPDASLISASALSPLTDADSLLTSGKTL